MSQLSHVFSTFKVFNNFTTDEIEVLSQYFSVKPFVNDHILMKKGEIGTYLCIILRGELNVVDENIVIVSRSAGDVLGEMALIRSSPRIADVVAISDGDIATIEFEDVTRLKREYPVIALKLVEILTESTIRKLNETEAALRNEKQRSEKLLLNILPHSIADQLKEKSDVIAQQFDDVTILFADIVGFTPLSSTMSPVELVNMLNRIFSAFDQLVECHDLEKIKTIGDAYMVVGGIPIPRDDHAEAVARMALDMQAAMDRLNTEDGSSFQIRIGINTGPGVAGVIGVKKFIYDLWGDTVNVASRMESSGVPGRIQVTAETYNRLRETFLFEERGMIKVKGKGDMKTYWLTGTK